MRLTTLAVIAVGKHLFPFRTEKLSPLAPMVLGGQPPGRVGSRQFFTTGRESGPSFFYDAGMELRAGNLVLRPPAERDLAAIVAACADDEISRFIPFVPSPYTEDDARAFLADVGEAWRLSPERTFAVADAECDEFLGVVTVRLREGGSVGYWLKREARGRGVMTEAVRAVVEWACGEHRIERLVLTAHPKNVASQRVAEKAGFRRVGMTDRKSVV